MEWVETTGRSVEEAKDAALDQLGVDESDAEFVVISEPRAGLFGRMRGEARVRARVRPTSPRPKRSRSRRQGSESKSPPRSRGTNTSSNGGRTREAAVSVAGAGRAKGSSLDVPEASDAAGLSGNGAAAEEPARSQSNRRRRSRGGGRTQTATAARDAAEGAESARGDGEDEDVRSASRQQHAGRARSNGLRHADETKEDVVGEDLSLEEQGEAARGFVEGLVHLLGLQGTVSTSVVDEETVQVAVDGAELGILIGPGGGTLAALQELARTVVQRQTGGRSERILVDVAGYRAKRAAALQRFTQQVAQEVLESSTERALEPMSASDRKIVHDTVNEIGGLVTRSVGEEPRRYIVVAPSSTSSAGHAEDEEPNDA